MFAYPCLSARAADHLDAPILVGNGQLDINDVYAFQSPSNADNTVLIMTVNPFAGVLSPTTFATTDVAYELLIDNTGDAIADVTYSAGFSSGIGGQNLALSRNSATVASGSVGASIAVSGGGTIQAGVFDDPFFFDLTGFTDGLNFTGDDSLAGANVSAIVLEVPNAELGGPNIAVWARTTSGGSQVDRIGRPAINTVLIPSNRKDEFNQTAPEQDSASFGDDVRATITALSSAANASALTDILLPDVLTFDTSNSAGFLNGRQLADDVIDAELGLLTEGALTGDGVDMNDVPFLSAFPYLAPAHVIPEPSGTALGILALIAGWRRVRRGRGRLSGRIGLVGAAPQR